MTTLPSIRPLLNYYPSSRKRPSAWLLAGLGLGMAALGGFPLSAAPLNVPNASFETPSPPPGFPATPQIDSWVKFPQPAGLPLPGGLTWDQLSGVFPNTASGAPDHIDNMHGNQAAYIFSVPGVGVYQDLGTAYGTGSAYSLTLGLIGGGGGMQPGSSILFGLYYRDAGNNPVSIGAANVAHSTAAFPTTTHFVDSQFAIPTVQAGDAWAGKSIGVQIIATAGQFDGYWDVDNLRLNVVPEPATISLWALGLAVVALRSRRQNRRQLPGNNG